MSRGTRAPRESLPPELIATIVEAVRREGAVTLSTLKLGILSRGAEASLLDALSKAGLEHTGKAIRRPLEAQVRAALFTAGSEGLTIAALGKRVRGARTAAEVALCVRKLAEVGVVVHVIVAKATKLALRDDAHLTESELAAVADVAKAINEIAKRTKAAKNKPRPTVTRDALEASRDRIAKIIPADSSRLVEVAVDAALRVAPTQGGLIRVPDVVRALETVYTRAAVLAAVDALARDGHVELRPEASLARMHDDDVVRCPRGIDGTPLSYARRSSAQERTA